ncbi:MAG: hypothetical protein ACNA8R_04600 [Nitriliruptoraceae bacterium]
MSLGPSDPASSPIDRLARLLVWLVPTGILVQAVLAGQGWFVDQGLFLLHGGVGHGVLTLALLVAGWAWWRRPSRTVLVLATLGVLGLIAQTGLGYTGRRGGVALASSLHVPLGTLLLTASVVVALLVSRPARTSR